MLTLSAKLVLSPLLVVQAVATRKKLPRLPEADGAREGVALAPTRSQPPAALLRLLVLGDSSAAGVGVAHQEQALAAPLAAVLALQSKHEVHWRLWARSGFTTAQVLDHVRSNCPGEFDVAVVVTGVNDVVDQVPTARANSQRDALVNWLRNGCAVQHVAFAPLPPVHRFPGLPQPLRWVAGCDAERHNAALADWAQTRDDVSLAPLELPLAPEVMAQDGFHPGEPVYRACAQGIGSHLARQVLPRLRLPAQRLN
jgi:lysophospholipase L1-like esterase